MAPIDPVALTQALVRCPSVTPDDAGALNLLSHHLEALGFEVTELTFSAPGTPDVDNLFARWGEGSPHMAWAGHVDVVPPGPADHWRHDPFAGDIVDDTLFGRGAVDMKSGLAAMLSAVGRYLDDNPNGPGSISFLITADEEGPARNGTVKLIEWAVDQGHEIDGCIVGEPTSRERLGDMIKIGRRGSLNALLTAQGRQGHVAYPEEADNAAHRLVKMLQLVMEGTLDRGSAWFDPSSLQITSIDIGNPAGNVIPSSARAHFNIRFNDQQTPARLDQWLRSRLDAAGGAYQLDLETSGGAFVTEPGPLVDKLRQSIEAITTIEPRLSTSGGTSDARFIVKFTPVVEFGLVGKTLHQSDEHVPCNEIRLLTDVYHDFLRRFLN